MQSSKHVIFLKAEAQFPQLASEVEWGHEGEGGRMQFQKMEKEGERDNFLLVGKPTAGVGMI